MCKKLVAYEDPKHEGNSPKYHTNRPCVEHGCDKPAGTKWGPHLCFKHNVERIRRIDRQMHDILSGGFEGATSG